MGSGRFMVTMIDAPSVPGYKALALCTEDGKPVGEQMRCNVNCEVNDVTTVTVTFYVDGDSIRLALADG